MKSNFCAFLLLAATCSTAFATTRYVDPNCATPTPPYTDWSTAATNIQDAVDAADGPDLILVTNGIYASGARSVYGLSNRLAVTRSKITVQSVNGPEQTIIQGWQVPGMTNGPGAIRCVYMQSDTVLSGFTLTNGATPASGPTDACSGGGVWATSSSAVVTNCVIAGNSAARNGGGVYGNCSVVNCLLIGNSATNGGGACGVNTHGVWLDNSRVIGNTGQLGGGLYNGSGHGSVFTDNRADSGGGAADSSLVSCTLTHNQARIGGGSYGGTLDNCIAYFNGGASANYSSSSTLNTCCTTPPPPSGVGNISLDPQLASASHLSAASPCRGAGADRWAVLKDFDGEAWQHPPSIGADEYNAGAVTGELSVAVSAPYTNVAAGFGMEFAAAIDGRTTASVWQFGDGTSVSNRPYAQHAWEDVGDYVVTLTAYNESHPEGVDASVIIHVQDAPTHYVKLGSTNPVAPYQTWETAAADIQSAVDTASVPGAVVMVGDGVYDTGGRVVDGQMTNRVVVDKPLVLRSVNGPAATSIIGYQVPVSANGDGAIRCAYLSRGAVLSGFTLTNGATRTGGDEALEQKGGAVWCASTAEVVTNCVLTRNAAYARGGGVCGGTLIHCKLSDNSAWYGGGVYASVLTGCVLTGNSSLVMGGGAYYSVLNNCTLAGNTPGVMGSAADSSWLNNCISYYNTSSTGQIRNHPGGTLNFCCTTPQPTGGFDNFTNAPLLMDVGARDFRLQTNSPCINAGANSYVSTATDLDGNPRIAGGTVNVGAYEFDKPLSLISYAWLQSYGLPTDGTADFVDYDADKLNAWQEWIAGTDPLDSSSVLRLLSAVPNFPAVTLTWQSVTNRTYSIQRAFNWAGQGGFTAIASNLPGGSGTTSFTNTNADDPGPGLYRVLVQRP